jgi:hypothetical protein
MFSITYLLLKTQLCSILFQIIQLAGSLPQQITNFLFSMKQLETDPKVNHSVTPGIIRNRFSQDISPPIFLGFRA